MFLEYHYDPNYLDRQVLENSVDPDQMASSGAVSSRSTLFAILSSSFGHITVLLNHIVQILG